MPKWAWAALCLVLVLLFGFLGFGITFWASHAALRWSECVFERAECSAPAATCMLGAIALVSLWAAGVTIYFARQAYYVARETYQMESAPRLGQSPCSKHVTPMHVPDREVFILSSPPEKRSEELNADERGLDSVTRPLDFHAATASVDYAVYHSAFNNLGRYALAAVEVYLTYKDRRGQLSPAINATIGNVLVDQETHVVVYISRAYGSESITWIDPRQQPVGSNKIAFFTEDVYEIAAFPTPDSQLLLPGT